MCKWRMAPKYYKQHGTSGSFVNEETLAMSIGKLATGFKDDCTLTKLVKLFFGCAASCSSLCLVNFLFFSQ